VGISYEDITGKGVVKSSRCAKTPGDVPTQLKAFNMDHRIAGTRCGMLSLGGFIGRRSLGAAFDFRPLTFDSLRKTHHFKSVCSEVEP
jgi:hypothetical protein